MLNILEGVKAVNPKPIGPAKFIIKAKASRESKVDDNDSFWATDQDVDQFLQYMIARSKRFRDLLDEKGIDNEQDFVERHLHHSVCTKTILKTILDKMLSDRRLGKNLKGMNKSNLAEIEAAIWPTLEREALIFKNDLEYTRQKDQFKEVLATRKAEIQEELKRLGSSQEAAK